MKTSEKFAMRTKSLADEKFDALIKLFPNAVTEKKDENGATVRAIDIETLTQEINSHVVRGKEERYQFTWPDKRKSILSANAPISAALRPARDESVDFDSTENLYIEGDNLNVLKLLRETYLNRVKMIYIDPPYNTGHDFIYEDDFAENADEFLRRDCQYDEQGNRLAANLDSNGRFHTDWLNMIYPRLRVARDLLTDDGVIFMSIDDNEVHNLRKVCDEVFGSVNFIDILIWQKLYGIKNDSKWFSHAHDYIIVFAKNKDRWYPNLLPRTNEANSRYKNPDNDPRGNWKSADFTAIGETKSSVFDIITPSGRIVSPPSGKRWIVSKETYEKLRADNRLWFGKNKNAIPAIKRFLSEVQNGIKQTTILTYQEVGHSDGANKELQKLLGGAYLDYPKPTSLVQRFIHLATNSNDLILDFFSGSATTAHAVMQLNAEDGGKRKFIMVQLPEICDKNSEAFKAGYKNICEIGKERIRRAGAKIKNENPTAELDAGFRVLKLDSSNMKEVYYTPEEYAKMAYNLEGLKENIKDDR
ncbi:MAG: site-specific DNA-methyltransferase, partial [Helicobacteraceae bacterium]|nr:site-specific DNA-methyltransferase [Helicobacteraceae bacterium]